MTTISNQRKGSYMIIDFHSHILPHMDDGAKDLNTSLSMLKKLKEDGVDIVVATPHFYRHKEEISTFLDRRSKSFEELKQAIDKKKYPKIVLGAEVYMSKSFVYEDFDSLCIEHTDYMLLEMPWHKWDNDILSTLDSIINKSNIRIVLAHIERYLKMVDRKYFNQVISKDVLLQMNCECFIQMGFFDKKNINTILNTGKVCAIGSDCHNMDSRSPNMKDGIKCLQSKFKKDTLDNIMESSKLILDNQL